MSDPPLTVVHAFSTRQDADVAVSALEAAGIEAMVSADTGGEMYRAIAWAGVGFQLLVRREDAEAAHTILELPASPVRE